MARGSRAQIRAASGTSDFSRLFDPHKADLFDDRVRETELFDPHHADLFVDTVQCSRVACTNIIETTDGFQWSRPVHRRFTAWLASGSFFCVVHSGRDGSQQSASRRVLLLSVGVGSQQSASLRWMVVAPKGLLSFFMVDLSHAYPRWTRLCTRLGECDVKHQSYTDGTWRSVCYIYQSRKRLCGLRPRYPVAELATG